MFEAQTLHGVVKLDVDADIIGIQLEFVAGRLRAVLVDRHDEPGHRPVDRNRPVVVLGGLGAKIEPGRRSCRFFRNSMHYIADLCYDWPKICMIVYLGIPAITMPGHEFPA